MRQVKDCLILHQPLSLEALLMTSRVVTASQLVKRDFSLYFDNLCDIKDNAYWIKLKFNSEELPIF